MVPSPVYNNSSSYLDTVKGMRDNHNEPISGYTPLIYPNIRGCESSQKFKIYRPQLDQEIFGENAEDRPLTSPTKHKSDNDHSSGSTGRSSI